MQWEGGGQERRLRALLQPICHILHLIGRLACLESLQLLAMSGQVERQTYPVGSLISLVGLIIQLL